MKPLLAFLVSKLLRPYFPKIDQETAILIIGGGLILIIYLAIKMIIYFWSDFDKDKE